MKAKITYRIRTTEEIIDLEDFGHDPEKSWNDLTTEEQNQIRDDLAEAQIIECSGKHFEE